MLFVKNAQYNPWKESVIFENIITCICHAKTRLSKWNEETPAISLPSTLPKIYIVQMFKKKEKSIFL